jgi:hypothetical protein
MSLPFSVLLAVIACFDAEIARVVVLATVVPAAWFLAVVWLLMLWPGKGAFR